jgi:hypothetical protein
MDKKKGIRFFYNGIKGEDGKLQKCSYSSTELKNYPKGTITIDAQGRTVFSEEIKADFEVINDTDIMTDYHDNDKIRVTPSHPRYSDVLEALKKGVLKRGY